MGFLPLSLGTRLHSLVDLAPGEIFCIVFGFTESLGVGQWLIIVCIVVAPRGTSWNCRPVVLGTVHEQRMKQPLLKHLTGRKVQQSKEAQRDKMIYWDQTVMPKHNQEWKHIWVWVQCLDAIPAFTPTYSIQKHTSSVQAICTYLWELLLMKEAQKMLEWNNTSIKTTCPLGIRIALHYSSALVEATCKQVKPPLHNSLASHGESRENSKDGNRNEEKQSKYQRFRYWMRLEEVVDYVILLNFNSILLSTL